MNMLNYGCLIVKSKYTKITHIIIIIIIIYVIIILIHAIIIILFVCLFDLILYVPSTIFQLYRNGSSWVEPVLS